MAFYKVIMLYCRYVAYKRSA